MGIALLKLQQRGKCLVLAGLWVRQTAVFACRSVPLQRKPLVRVHIDIGEGKERPFLQLCVAAAADLLQIVDGTFRIACIVVFGSVC